MNELTIHGNVSRIHETRHTRNGQTVVSFDVAFEDRYFDRTKGVWVGRGAIFQKVVAYRQLAANAGATLKVGTTVTVTGKLIDDSWVPEHGQYRVVRTMLEAHDISVSLRFATATVTKNKDDEAPAESPSEDQSLTADGDEAQVA